ncbi:MAG: iron-siderophore ABC transporter substrate-binding protein [Cyanobacteria bacterium Co-bin8]|nr:iron-siderophore ABC transporter substrate-binding protein [Cyanobacteria bacterium Co-bin8]
MRRRSCLLALFLLALGLVVGCQGRTDLAGTVENCTPVEHAAGSSCVPKAFERLVTLDGMSFEDAIASGLAPVATSFSGLVGHLEEHLVGVENVGQAGEPNLESVLALKPDLILGLDHHQGIYGQAAQIAPTVLFASEHSGQWKERFKRVGEALGQAEAVEQTMDAYYARLADFKAQMGEHLQGLKVSVVRIYPDTINLYLRDSFSGTVLQDAGLSRPAAQDIGAEEATARFDNPIQTSISQELLGQADGDVIFLWTGENTAEAAETAQEKLQTLQQDPLWQQLKAVQQGRVYVVPSYWIGSGAVAANLVIDDLFTYLVTHSRNKHE